MDIHDFTEDFVLEELKKIQYLFGLKRVIRYAEDRTDDDSTESVAEHVYAMHVLADYFLPLEDSSQLLNWKKVHDMIRYHDIDELETGDKVGYLKTSADRANETPAAERVIKNMPASLQATVSALIEEYDALSSAEAKFVKAIDRIEPMFHLYDKRGKAVLERLGTTRAQNDSIKTKYVAPYPFIKRFFEVGTNAMEKEGFFKPE